MKTIQQYTGNLVVGCVFACCLFQNVNAQIPPGGGGGGTNTYNPPPDISNYLKYRAQSFSVIDSNNAAAYDTNLYNALLAFGDSGSTNPTLQVLPYQANCLIFKASHFDYSGETTRDFCLAVCDKLETPLYKNIDLFNPSNNIQNGGWLVQGSVPNLRVTDPMFLMVSNTSRIYNGFFRIVPYAGPEVQLVGQQPYDVVSNTILLQVIVTDLSGITNEAFQVTVDGGPARYHIGSTNTVSLETKYNPNGLANIYFKTLNTARIYDPTNPPDNSKVYFSGSAVIPLDFENDTYLAFASDNCPPEIGTNRIYFVIDKAQQIEATISNPSNGQVVAHYSGNVPFPATVVIPWNFTEADHVTPYTNDTYKIEFIAYDPTTITITNLIDRQGVRNPASCFLTYQEQDAFSANDGYLNNYLNQQGNIWINQTLKYLFSDLYQALSLTQYYAAQVGANRNHPDCQILDAGHPEWAAFMQPALASVNYSELTIAQAHGNGVEVGGGGYLLNKFDTHDLITWLRAYPYQNWRLRKAAIWTCFSAADASFTVNRSFPDACGIRTVYQQYNSYVQKNCGLFFGNFLPANGYTGNAVTARIAEAVDQTWVCGKYQYAGGCDPTYSFDFAIQATLQDYPELITTEPMRYGYGLMIYSSVFDDDLQRLGTSHVKTH